jgi:NitT/TauT family transport system substrate-binding protein
VTRTARAIAGSLLAAALLTACTGNAEPAETPSAPAPAATAEAEETTPAEEPTTVRIASLKGPTTMGLVDLMRDAEAGETEQDYEVTMYGAPDEVVPLVVQGSVDVALIPANLAAVLYNRTLTDDGAAVQVAAINTLGVLGILENGDTVHSMADLAGRTIIASGKGAAPEYTLNYLLTENGIDPTTDVTIEWRSEHTEVAALLASTPGAVAMLPQPFATVVTVQNETVRPALDLTEEWTKVTEDGSQLITGVVVVRTAFVEEHPQAFADFLADYEESVAFTNDNPAEAAELIAEAGIVPAAPVAQAAIPKSYITFIAGPELKEAFSGYLQVLFDADPASVGGSMPGDDFYYGG